MAFVYGPARSNRSSFIHRSPPKPMVYTPSSGLSAYSVMPPQARPQDSVAWPTTPPPPLPAAYYAQHSYLPPSSSSCPYQPYHLPHIVTEQDSSSIPSDPFNNVATNPSQQRSLNRDGVKLGRVDEEDFIVLNGVKYVKARDDEATRGHTVDDRTNTSQKLDDDEDDHFSADQENPELSAEDEAPSSNLNFGRVDDRVNIDGIGRGYASKDARNVDGNNGLISNSAGTLNNTIPALGLFDGRSIRVLVGASNVYEFTVSRVAMSGLLAWAKLSGRIENLDKDEPLILSDLDVDAFARIIEYTYSQYWSTTQDPLSGWSARTVGPLYRAAKYFGLSFLAYDAIEVLRSEDRLATFLDTAYNIYSMSNIDAEFRDFFRSNFARLLEHLPPPCDHLPESRGWLIVCEYCDIENRLKQSMECLAFQEDYLSVLVDRALDRISTENDIKSVVSENKKQEDEECYGWSDTAEPCEESHNPFFSDHGVVPFHVRETGWGVPNAENVNEWEDRGNVSYYSGHNTQWVNANSTKIAESVVPGNASSENDLPEATIAPTLNDTSGGQNAVQDWSDGSSEDSSDVERPPGETGKTLFVSNFPRSVGRLQVTKRLCSLLSKRGADAAIHVEGWPGPRSQLFALMTFNDYIEASRCYDSLQGLLWKPKERKKSGNIEMFVDWARGDIAENFAICEAWRGMKVRSFCDSTSEDASAMNKSGISVIALKDSDSWDCSIRFKTGNFLNDVTCTDIPPRSTVDSDATVPILRGVFNGVSGTFPMTYVSFDISKTR